MSTIFGPPGTGKTTELLNIVDSRLQAGVSPRDIGFVAFTRKAANEARTRACERFKIAPEELTNFRTLHSLAFRKLGLTNAQVMGVGDYISLARSLGIYITTRGVNEDGAFTGMTRGDRLMFMEQMARARMMGLHAYWSQFPDEDIQFEELDQVARTVARYKEVGGKVDFIDMMLLYCEERPHTWFDTLLIDEAQDLSPLQWRMVAELARTADQVIYAGDDDQAIFTWAGADVQAFMGTRGDDWRVLSQSYRCPQAVWSVARSIAIQINQRVPKDWGPAKHDGEVHHVSDLTQVDMSQGTWLLLARNLYLLESLAQHCLSNGLVFSSALPGHVNWSEFTSPIMTWERLRRGEYQRAIEVRGAMDLMSVGVGVRRGHKRDIDNMPDDSVVTMMDLTSKHGVLTTKVWHEALDRIPAQVREYFLAALRRGEKLLKEPRIRISTIHGVKGGEADNVLLLTDMAQRSWNEYHQDPDSEHRVWYVGVTRARHSLYIMRPATNMHYAI